MSTHRYMSLRIDFCEWSGLGQLSLQSMKQLNWLTCYDGIDHDLRTFFKNSLHYYNWKKEQEGGINHYAALPEMPEICEDSCSSTDSIDSPSSPAGSIIEEDSWDSLDGHVEPLLGEDNSAEAKAAATDALADCTTSDNEEDSATPTSAYPCANEHPAPPSHPVRNGNVHSVDIKIDSSQLESPGEAPECIALAEEEDDVFDEAVPNIIPTSSSPRNSAIEETTALPISQSNKTSKRQHPEIQITHVKSGEEGVVVEIDEDDEINCIWQAPMVKRRRLCSSSDAPSSELRNAPFRPTKKWPIFHRRKSCSNGAGERSQK